MSNSLFLFTFNCAKLPQTDFSELIQALPDEIPDVLVFGFQELVPILDSTLPAKVNESLFAINETLHEILKEKYSASSLINTVSVHHLGAIGLLVMTPYQSEVENVHSAVASCGVFYSSLKGAVSTRLTFKSQEYTFVSAHLSANEGYVVRRNQDAWRLLRSLEFEDGWSCIKPDTHTFFMGDLNYRNAIYGDELKRQMEEGEAFKGFTEQDVHFDPTYKFFVGTSDYNPKRVSSWCDRVLYIPYEQDVKLVKYDSLPFRSSDHRPVVLSIKIPNKPPKRIIDNKGYLIEGGEYLKATYMSKVENYAMIISDSVIGLSLLSVSTTTGRVLLVSLALLVLYFLR